MTDTAVLAHGEAQRRVAKVLSSDTTTSVPNCSIPHCLGSFFIT